MALSIPTQLAKNGFLKLKRHNALKLTGRLFKLRRDINLVSNVLDVPELFWSEASLKELYDAVREYMEIGVRVQALNEKLVVAGDFVSHLGTQALSPYSQAFLAARGDSRSSQPSCHGTHNMDHHLVRVFPWYSDIMALTTMGAVI
jgi:hypothetical protein